MIIGLCGYTGVGKDTIAQYLVDKYDFTRVAFADAMREDLYKLNPIIVDKERVNRALRQVYGQGTLMLEEYCELQEAGIELLPLLCSYTGETADTIKQDIRNRTINSNTVRVAVVMAIDASRLKDAVDRLGWDQAKRVYPEIRRLLQVYGTEVGREGFGESIWLDRALKKIRAAKGGVVITDVRFQNELSFLRMLNTYRDGLAIIHVTRPGHGAINGHASEQLDYASICDYTISNSGSIDDLHSAIEEQIACVVK